MNLALAILIVVLSTAVAVAAILLVRRRAPEGSHFRDGDRASGVFGVLATGFSVLLGLVVVLAFTSYDASRVGAETEAITVAQQFETAQLMPAAAGRRLADQLICYGRSVVGQEWPRMEQGEQHDALNRWGVAMFRTLKTAVPRTAVEQSAFDTWLAQRFDRETARSARIHGAAGVIPAPLWVVLFVIAGLIFVFMLFFADSDESPIVQATLIGTVVAAIASILMVIAFLDSPFRPGLGSLRPVAMERTLRVLEQERRLLGRTAPVPCDADGAAPR
jgi:hypothetical protein